MFDMGAKNVLEKILPVVDNFERGLATPIVDEADQPFADRYADDLQAADETA